MATQLLLKLVDKSVMLFTERNSWRGWDLKEQVISALLDLLSDWHLQSFQKIR